MFGATRHVIDHLVSKIQQKCVCGRESLESSGAMTRDQQRFYLGSGSRLATA